MVKKLTRHGNSYALVIDKPIMELLNISGETPLNLTTDGQSLVVSPVVDEAEEAKFRSAVKKVHKRYGRMLKALAE
ncbi:MAG TPA: AbrB/MazE/SpoVT family DNA-binding domain-containing protein [Tepidisphaeraceae bacterium]|nr:AbrB/MazE/SpoVT family DNA-binding domain-containing protein [Tepidisphaeraceae bacterium]